MAKGNRGPKWAPEGEDAVVLARAILTGVVTEDLQTFKDFFDPDSTGPGAEIGERFAFQTSKGRRNLQLNYRKLIKKIRCWLVNQLDPLSGKRK